MGVNGNGANGNGRLTGKQEAFVVAYVGEAKFNATKAAGIAGYSGDYWTLAAMASENLKKPKIIERVRQYLGAQAMTADEVLWRLGEIARGGWAEYIKDNGDVDIAGMVADDKAYLITEIRDTREGRVYKFCDMQAALNQIGKHHGLFVERHELTGADGGAIVLQWPEDDESHTT